MLKGLVLTERKGNSRNESSRNKKSHSGSGAEPPADSEKSFAETIQALGLNLILPESTVSPKPVPKLEQDIASLIEIDTNFVNFGSFYPGKIFKCNLGIKNLTNHKRTVTVGFENTEPEFSSGHLLRTLFMGPLPTSVTYPVPNSEYANHCWYFMQPPSKAFEKTMTLTLSAHASTQVGVVIKSPCIAHTEKFFSLLQVTLASEDPMSQLLGSSRSSLIALCQAEVITPKLECCRELLHEQAGINVVPLVVKFDGSVQRLRIPFKNNGAKDLDLILSIVKFPTAAGKPENPPLAEYHCVPNTIKISANALGFVTIGVNQCDSGSTKNSHKEEREQRVLIVKVKDTLMMYSYVLDCCFIP